MPAVPEVPLLLLLVPVEPVDELRPALVGLLRIWSFICVVLPLLPVLLPTLAFCCAVPLVLVLSPMLLLRLPVPLVLVLVLLLLPVLVLVLPVLLPPAALPVALLLRSRSAVLLVLLLVLLVLLVVSLPVVAVPLPVVDCAMTTPVLASKAALATPISHFVFRLLISVSGCVEGRHPSLSGTVKRTRQRACPAFARGAVGEAGTAFAGHSNPQRAQSLLLQPNEV
jgi:hypothetical protein